MIEQEQGASRQVKNNKVQTLAFVTFLIIVSGMGLNIRECETRYILTKDKFYVTFHVRGNQSTWRKSTTFGKALIYSFDIAIGFESHWRQVF